MNGTGAHVYFGLICTCVFPVYLGWMYVLPRVECVALQHVCMLDGYAHVHVGWIYTSTQVECVALGPTGEGSQRGKFMAVGGMAEGAWSLFVFRLDAGSGAGLKLESRMLLQGKPLSVCLSTARDGPWGAGEGAGSGGENPLVCYVGLESEMLVRVHVDGGGQVSQDFRTRSLGARSGGEAPQPVRLVPVTAQGLPAVLALCSRPWLIYSHQRANRMTPLAYDVMEHAAAFSSPQCPEGLVCVMGNTLRILAVHHYGDTFQQQTLRLAYTPRKSAALRDAGALVLIETDHNTDSSKAKLFGMTAVPGVDTAEADAEGEGKTPYQTFGVQRAGEGKWASCVRVVDVSGKIVTKQVFELPEDEAAVSVCACSFAERPAETFVLVGSVLGLKSRARAPQGMVYVYSVTEGAHLTLLHKTPVDGVPRAICAFQVFTQSAMHTHADADR